MAKVTLTGTLLCATSQDAALVAAHVPDHIRLTRAEPGCLHFDVAPKANPLIWEVNETFVDRAAFDAHQTRTKASAWAALTAHIPRDFAISEQA
ncbi:MAG: antibiotic biosynthesis monooxygenase [Paracoccaceae bacterium]|nr:antibiotic biosynthesis monooxygenase [Paracoccaceae bacterium]